MDEEKIKIKMDDGVEHGFSLASEGICLFVDLLSQLRTSKFFELSEPCSAN